MAHEMDLSQRQKGMESVQITRAMTEDLKKIVADVSQIKKQVKMVFVLLILFLEATLFKGAV